MICVFHPDFKLCTECKSLVCTECFPHCKTCETQEALILKMKEEVLDKNLEREGKRKDNSAPPLTLTKEEKSENNFHRHTNMYLKCSLSTPKS